MALLALLRALGHEELSAADVDLSLTRQEASAVMASSPVEYVRTARLHGSLWEENVRDGTVSSADRGFLVDHGDPMAALEAMRQKGVSWPFGELLEAHENLVMVKAKEVASVTTHTSEPASA